MEKIVLIHLNCPWRLEFTLPVFERRFCRCCEEFLEEFCLYNRDAERQDALMDDTDLSADDIFLRTQKYYTLLAAERAERLPSWQGCQDSDLK